MKVFLTGGTGYLGSALLAGLLDAGHQVTALCRTPRADPPEGRLHWVVGDLKSAPPDEELLHQHRVVLHAAALVKTWVRDSREFDRVNVDAHDALLEKCYRVGVQKVLVTSSFLSLGPSPTPEPLRESDRTTRDAFLTDYERTKYLADQVTDRWASRGLAVSTLYPTVLYGPGATTDGNLVGKMAYMIRRGTFPGVIGSGKQSWNYAYLPDVVRGHLQALDRALPGERYILGGENRLLDDVVSRIQELLGRNPRPRYLPIELAEWLGSAFELWARVSGQTPELTRGVAGVYRHHWAYTSEKAERALGYTHTPFDAALAATVAWVKELQRW